MIAHKMSSVGSSVMYPMMLSSVTPATQCQARSRCLRAPSPRGRPGKVSGAFRSHLHILPRKSRHRNGTAGPIQEHLSFRCFPWSRCDAECYEYSLWTTTEATLDRLEETGQVIKPNHSIIEHTKVGTIRRVYTRSGLTCDKHASPAGTRRQNAGSRRRSIPLGYHALSVAERCALAHIP